MRNLRFFNQSSKSLLVTGLKNSGILGGALRRMFLGAIFFADLILMLATKFFYRRQFFGGLPGAIVSPPPLNLTLIVVFSTISFAALYPTCRRFT